MAKDDPDDVVVGLCVFPDLSFIDEWGLAYHSNGDIRGKDLTTVMEYQPGADLPPVFPVSRSPRPPDRRLLESDGHPGPPRALPDTGGTAGQPPGRLPATDQVLSG